MANKALKLIAGTALTGLVAMPNPLWAAITAAPAISSSTHTANQTSTASDITLSWTAATSDQTGDTVTYEFLFDTNTSHTLSSFQSAFEANGGSNDAVPFNGTLTNTSRSFNDVPDGTYYFHLQAYDTDGPLSGSNIQTFGPLKLNSVPTLVSSPISPASGNHSQTVSVTLSGSRFMDGATASLFGPNDVTGVTAAKVSLTSVVVVDANTITATVPANIIPGTYDVRVTNPAPFNQQVSSSNKFSSSNTAPTANAGTDQVVDMTSGSANLSLNGASSSDADGDTLTTYTWTVLDKPSGSALSVGQEYTGSTQSISVSVTGTYQFGLIVSDGYKSSTQDTVNFTVQSTSANNPPTADAGTNVAAVVGSSVSLDGSASADTDGDTLTYSWSFTSRPSGSAAAFDDATSSTPSFTADLAGTYNVSLTVNDGTDSDSDSMVVTVTSISLDVDGDGDADANDGVMIQRRLTGAGTVTTNISLPTSVGGSGSGGARTNSEVVAAIDAAGTGFDVDGDTDADANDGVMIQRRLTGAGTVTTNISLPTGVGGTGTGGAMSNGEVVVVIDNITP